MSVVDARFLFKYGSNMVQIWFKYRPFNDSFKSPMIPESYMPNDYPIFDWKMSEWIHGSV